MLQVALFVTRKGSRLSPTSLDGSVLNPQSLWERDATAIADTMVEEAPRFIRTDGFEGRKAAYVFTTGPIGLGYYCDVAVHVAASGGVAALARPVSAVQHMM